MSKEAARYQVRLHDEERGQKSTSNQGKCLRFYWSTVHPMNVSQDVTFSMACSNQPSIPSVPARLHLVTPCYSLLHLYWVKLLRLIGVQRTIVSIDLLWLHLQMFVFITCLLWCKLFTFQHSLHREARIRNFISETKEGNKIGHMDGKM